MEIKANFAAIVNIFTSNTGWQWDKKTYKLNHSKGRFLFYKRVVKWANWLCIN